MRTGIVKDIIPNAEGCTDFKMWSSACECFDARPPPYILFLGYAQTSYGGTQEASQWHCPFRKLSPPQAHRHAKSSPQAFKDT